MQRHDERLREGACDCDRFVGGKGEMRWSHFQDAGRPSEEHHEGGSESLLDFSDATALSTRVVAEFALARLSSRPSQ